MDGQVRKQGVGLEDGIDGTFVARNLRGIDAADANRAFVWQIEAANDSQQRGLAASRRAEQ